VDDSVRHVAARLRAWRREAGLSLQELGKRSGVSPSTIHKIEHDQTVPTIAVVLKLAAGLERRPSALFEECARRPAAIHVRAGDRRQLRTDGGVVLQALAGDASGRDIGVWRVVHPPGFSFGGRTMQHGHGDMVIYVERGRLEVCVDEQRYAVAAGDSLHFQASAPHAWRNDGEDVAIAIILGRATTNGRSAVLARLRRLGLEPRPEPPARAAAAEMVTSA
jgi:transcriptional regulator with XRE-family HTH domain